MTLPENEYRNTHWLPTPEILTPEEKVRRTATHPQMSWKEGIYKGNKMEAPRGEDPVILSKGFA